MKDLIKKFWIFFLLGVPFGACLAIYENLCTPTPGAFIAITLVGGLIISAAVWIIRLIKKRTT